MQENIISWNLANWVSVVLMALIGFTVLGAAVKFVQGKRNAGQISTTPNQTPQQAA
jgi:hypothetical protein